MEQAALGTRTLIQVTANRVSKIVIQNQGQQVGKGQEKQSIAQTMPKDNPKSKSTNTASRRVKQSGTVKA